MKNKSSLPITSAEVRQSFIDYFKGHDHSVQPSSPVILLDDPTLLFVNAGMCQFKDVFTGSRKVSFSRATSYQRCIRVGGKHNDLANVGQTSRHHTFFEMLGNFSFGDYFKEEAISYAWEYFTNVLKLDPGRLYASVYNDDDEAFKLWEKIAPELKNGRILRFGKEDNYWSMGDVGPCGPSSEIHYDMGDHLSTDIKDAWINTENDRYVEIWNLVFMQFDQLPDGKIVDLPKPSVDTGAGLERLVAVMQNVDSNYDTDLFQPLVHHVAEITGVKYSKGKDGVSARVIADHVRALTFALADGGGLSNEGRGYVLRRILRRAARHGRLLGYNKPIICQLVPTLIEIMGGHYTELAEKQNHIEKVIRSEEERFGELLGTGLELFASLEKKVKASGSDTISGDSAFKLYDTYGFPVDMTAIMAEEAGLKLDMAGFEKAMKRQQEKSRAGSKFGFHVLEIMKKTIEIMISSSDPEKKEIDNDVKGDKTNVYELETKVFHWEESEAGEIIQRNFQEISVASSKEVMVLLEKTPFYVESGGQADDTGVIYGESAEMVVTRLLSHQSAIAHFGYMKKGKLYNGMAVTAKVDIDRRKDIMRNHTATHLLQAALREVLGNHVKQSGSLVEADYIRFDFTHSQGMTAEEVAKVEKIVNDQILSANKVSTVEMTPDEAKKSGATALFGEKYGDKVRVVSVGEGTFSMELCGGTHVSNSSEIGSFLITVETAVASGVRRIEAVTGRKAAELSQQNKQIVQKLGTLYNVPSDQVTESAHKVSKSLSDLQKENKKLKSERFSGGSAGNATIGSQEKIGAIEFHYHDFGEADQDSMAGWSDAVKASNSAALSLAAGMLNGKSTFMVSASGLAIKLGFDCGKDFGALIRELGGRGGGKPAFARGSLPGGLDFDELVAKAKSMIQEK